MHITKETIAMWRCDQDCGDGKVYQLTNVIQNYVSNRHIYNNIRSLSCEIGFERCLQNGGFNDPLNPSPIDPLNATINLITPSLTKRFQRPT